VPYLLAKFVFTELKYPGWVGLKADELSAKCKPYALEARAHWKWLKVLGSSRCRTSGAVSTMGARSRRTSGATGCST
jgi:hypothetical protein